jgi:hypothetical protein
MATKNITLTPAETVFAIEALRKLALQRDTLRKYALDEDSERYDEESAEAYAEDIVFIKDTLAKLGDTKPLVTKSERKALAKKSAKAKAKATKGKVTTVKVTKSSPAELAQAILA